MKTPREKQLEEENTENPAFKKKALEILKENSDLIIFVRYSANKDYYHIRTESEFDAFLKNRMSKECLTLFLKKFDVVARGVFTGNFIQKNKVLIAESTSVDWVLISREQDGSQLSIWISEEEDLNEMIEDLEGTEVLIIKDQDWFNEDITVHAYVPDEDGIVRPEAY
ncbi:MAG: hypothetical protein AAF391_01820 [Bacteroidota bacterium]